MVLAIQPRTLLEAQELKRSALEEKADQIEFFWKALCDQPTETIRRFMAIPEEKRDPARAALIQLYRWQDRRISFKEMPECAALKEKWGKALRVSKGRMVACHPYSASENDQRQVGVLRFDFQFHLGKGEMDAHQFHAFFDKITEGKMAWMDYDMVEASHFPLSDCTGRMYFPVWMNLLPDDGKGWAFPVAEPCGKKNGEAERKGVRPEPLWRDRQVLDVSALKEITKAQENLVSKGKMAAHSAAQGFFRSEGPSDVDFWIAHYSDEENRLYQEGLRPQSVKDRLGEIEDRYDSRQRELREQIKALEQKLALLDAERQREGIQVIEESLGVRTGDCLINVETGQVVRLGADGWDLIGAPLPEDADGKVVHDIEEGVRRRDWVLYEEVEPSLTLG